jgi:hypothetical protein
MDDDLGMCSRRRKNVVAITMRLVQLSDGDGLGDHLYARCGFKTDRSDVMMTIKVRRRLLDAENAIIQDALLFAHSELNALLRTQCLKFVKCKFAFLG